MSVWCSTTYLRMILISCRRCSKDECLQTFRATWLVKPLPSAQCVRGCLYAYDLSYVPELPAELSGSLC